MPGGCFRTTRLRAAITNANAAARSTLASGLRGVERSGGVDPMSNGL